MVKGPVPERKPTPADEGRIDLGKLESQRDWLLGSSKMLIPELSPEEASLFREISDRLMREGSESMAKASSAVRVPRSEAAERDSALRRAVETALLTGYGIGRYDVAVGKNRGSGAGQPGITDGIIGLGVEDPHHRLMLVELATHIPRLDKEGTVLFRMIAAKIMREEEVPFAKELVSHEIARRDEEGVAGVANHIIKRAVLVGYGIARYDAAHGVNRGVSLRRRA